MDLQTIWSGIYTNLSGFNEYQKGEIKQAVFHELGKYSITEKVECKQLANYNDDMKGYRMFFVSKRVEGLSKKSLKYYKFVIDNFLREIPKKLTEYTTDDVRYYLALREIDDKVSPVTADTERRILNGFFGWLSNEEYIRKNICAQIKQVKKPIKKKKAFSEIEIAKIKDACFEIKTDIERRRAIALVEFLLSTGCRVNEISMLKKDDIDFEARTAVVLGKGSKERTVYLNQVAKMRLQEYFNARTDDCEYAFCSLNKPFTKLNVSGIEVVIRNIGKNSGVKNCHPHRFRRTTATMALKKGMSLLDVQRMLGHESIETTKIYLDLDDTDLRHQHEKFM